MTIASIAGGTRSGRTPAPTDPLARALADLAADFEELLFLCNGAQTRLAELATRFAGACIQAPTRAMLAREVESMRGRYRRPAEHLISLQREAMDSAASRSLVGELREQKARLADLLRAEQALLAGLLGAADWQSPSFRHSIVSASGTQEGRIQAHWNDYKRDRHLDGDDYEREYVEELVDGPAGLRALLTGCGMAAFTTVLAYLLGEGKLRRPVVASAGIYHESRWLLERALPGQIEFIDERHTGSLVRAIGELAPSAVFLDSLSNTAWMPVPDLPEVITHLRGSDTYLIVDNTCLSVGCQPFALARESVRLISFESLLKYSQLGLDRANAGLIIATCKDAALLDEYREHLGTNIADVAVHALPRPDRGVLERRLARLERNALFLAECLSERAPAGVAIVYPGTPSHPGAAPAPPLRFRGGCLSVLFREPDDYPRENALVEEAVAEADERGVALIAGASFGFDTTRIYLAGARAEYGRAFVRIAAGTEDRLSLEALAEVLVDAVERVAG